MGSEQEPSASQHPNAVQREPSAHKNRDDVRVHSNQPVVHHGSVLWGGFHGLEHLLKDIAEGAGIGVRVSTHPLDTPLLTNYLRPSGAKHFEPSRPSLTIGAEDGHHGRGGVARF